MIMISVKTQNRKTLKDEILILSLTTEMSLA